MAARTDQKETVADRGQNSDIKDASKLSPEDRHRRLYAWFQQEMRRQATNRFQMAMDEDYYDSMQWQADEAKELQDRGQSPVVYNEVKPTIDWLIGTERRLRTDFKVYSRDDSPDGDEDAKVKSKLLKYLSDVNRAPYERSASADDTFKAGVGYIEIGVSPDPEDELIYKRHESWRNCLYDSLGTRRDLGDSRYFFRFRIVDLDVAVAYFPDKEQQLRAACVGLDQEHYLEWWNGRPIEEVEIASLLPGKYTQYDSDAWSGNDRQRVLLIECWHYEYTRETRGGASSVDRVRKKMHVTIMTEKTEILTAPSPYRHNKYPFVPYWAYRRKRDNAPYSPVRPLRGPQDSLNKRISKSLFVLSTNQVIAEEDAFNSQIMTSDEVRDELASPDGFAVLAKGGIEKIKTVRENDVAQGHLQLAQIDQAMIRNASGISDENLNRTTSVQSGVALGRKDEQGSKLTAELFDNLRFARQLEGELELSLIEQFYSQPKVFSIAGERSKREYVRINHTGPDGSKVNDVTARQAQFVIGEQEWRQTLMQAAFESLMDVLSKLAPAAPQVVVALLDVVFELADIDNKQLVLQRIRTVTGYNDPDQPLTPEEQAAQAKKQQQADMQGKLQLQQLINDIKAAEAKGEQLSAQSLKTRVESLYVAMQAAQVVATVPHVTPVADQLLASAGFKDAHPQATATGVTPPQATGGMPDAAAPPDVTPGPGGAPEIPSPDAPDGGSPGAPQPAQGDGEATGIQTPAADGINPQEQPQ